MRTDSDILDALPFGVLRLEGDTITYVNRLLRSLLDGELSGFSNVANRYPELEALRTIDGTSQTPVWLKINASVFCVASTRQGKAVEYCFLPGWFVSATDDGLKTLQDNHDDFVEIFENCFDGIYVADGSGRTLWMNAGFERCYGLSARHFLGRDAGDLEREGYLKPLITRKIISTKQRQTALQTTRSGRKVLATGIPLLGQDGNVRRVIINSRDTTELIEIQSKLSDAEREIQNYESELRQLRKRSTHDGEMFWASDQMQEMVRLAMRLARTEAATLITGPSGSGKRKLADLVFRYSKRDRKRLFRIGFGTLPESAYEAELFGSRDGPRNLSESLLDRAIGGTLILERLDLMPPGIQEKLSGWCREEDKRRRQGPGVRLISTSREDLGRKVADGTFREDLFYRLSIAPIEIPPLSGRFADIAGLAHHFLEAFNKKYGAEKYFDRAAVNRLTRWTWPGNVRELRTLVERIVVSEPGSKISARMVQAVLASTATLAPKPDLPATRLSADEIRDQVRTYEAELLRIQVDIAGSIHKAANATGLSVSTFKRKLAWKKAVEEDIERPMTVKNETG
jgi:PAS domain S-box-containing protein